MSSSAAKSNFDVNLTTVMFTVTGQCLFGLSSMYYNATHMYGLVRTNTVVRSIKKEVFAQLMTEKNLWPDLTKVLSWYICVMSKRDDVLVAAVRILLFVNFYMRLTI